MAENESNLSVTEGEESFADQEVSLEYGDTSSIPAVDVTAEDEDNEDAEEFNEASAMDLTNDETEADTMDQTDDAVLLQDVDESEDVEESVREEIEEKGEDEKDEESKKTEAEDEYEAEKAAEKLANKVSAASLAQRERRKKEIEEEKQAMKVDLNIMPQVNVANLATRKFQLKLYPLRPSDLINGVTSSAFRLANETLLYMYTVGKMSNGKAELYISNFNKMFGVMQRLLKLEFHFPEINIKIIRKDDEKTVVERGFIRFDSRMMKNLLMQSRRIGGKRERVIGSVFVRNLPENTTKEMLRLMFPFAAEVNYNPEKFKDGTARIVLGNRAAVAPCLKAFLKVELNGKELEMRPLEKRKKPEGEKTTESSKTEENLSDDKEKPADDGKENEGEDKEKESPAKEPSQAGDAKVESDSPKKTPTKQADTEKDANRKGKEPQPAKKGDKSRVRELAEKQRQRARDMFQRNRKGGRPGAFGRAEDRSRGRGRLRRSPMRGDRSHFDDGFMTGQANSTENMIHLQAQLSAAIKNQLTMLNQTQLAVETVKREAAMAAAVSRAADFITPGPSVADQRRQQVQKRQEQRRLQEQRRQQEQRKQQALSPRNRPGQDRRRMKNNALPSGARGDKRTAADAGLSDFTEDDLFFRNEQRDFSSSRSRNDEPTDSYGSQRERQSVLQQQQQHLLQQRKEQEKRQMQERQGRQNQLQMMGEQRPLLSLQTDGSRGRAAGKRNRNRNRKDNPQRQQQQQSFRQQGSLQSLQAQSLQARQQAQNLQQQQRLRLQQQSYEQDYDEEYGYGNTQAYNARSARGYGAAATAGSNFGTGAVGTSLEGSFGTGSALRGFGYGGTGANSLTSANQYSHSTDYGWQGY